MGGRVSRGIDFNVCPCNFGGHVTLIVSYRHNFRFTGELTAGAGQMTLRDGIMTDGVPFGP